MQIVPMRLFFQKKGRLKYISHLDMINVFSRALQRSGLPVWYTQGYNPRVYVSFPLPLSLGYEGEQEILDIRLTEKVDGEEIKDTLNKVLPAELGVLSADKPQKDPREISWADYELELYLPDCGKKLETVFLNLWNQPEVLVAKRSKKGDQKVDLLPWVEVQNVSSTKDELLIQARIATGSQFNINPRLIAQALEAAGDLELEGLSVKRKKTYDKQQSVFS